MANSEFIQMIKAEAERSCKADTSLKTLVFTKIKKYFAQNNGTVPL
ncbi:hypothetical protein EV281_11539 [Rhizobium sp. BK418]|nr:hypothetical protein EV281_11539 [Rhizobium sp. BK418]